MLDSMLAIQPLVIARYIATGVAPQRVGNRHPISAPFGVFEAKDGSFVLAVLNEKLMATLGRVIGDTTIASDPRYATDALRFTHEVDLRRSIEAWSRQHGVSAVVAALVEAGVPAAPVETMAEALASDQVKARPILQSVAHPALGALDVPEQPVRFSGVPRGGIDPAPRLGEASEAILADPDNAWRTER
jgi:CoA:oxalate CoA-transferase